MVETVTGGPADRAGLQGATKILRLGNRRLPVAGDVILAIDSQPIRDRQALTVYLETRTQVGQRVTVTVFRAGKKLDLEVRLTER